MLIKETNIIDTATQRIKSRLRKTSEDIIEIGKDLILIKEKLPHGEFLPWIEKEFEMKERTARNFMNVAKRFPKSATVADLTSRVLYELASPSTPPEVIEKVQEKANHGERVSVADVKALKSEYKEDFEEVKPQIFEKPDVYFDDEYQDAVEKVKKPWVTQNTGNNEWYTPPVFIEAARAVMGSIDTDPASCETANQNVKAKQFYTEETNGLMQIWNGNVWMNPPYSQPLVSDFCGTLVDKYLEGEINQAIVLVPNATETKFFQNMLSACAAVCFPETRIRFIDTNGIKKPGSPLSGHAILYFGGNKKKFKNLFSQFGSVLYDSK